MSVAASAPERWTKAASVACWGVLGAHIYIPGSNGIFEVLAQLEGPVDNVRLRMNTLRNRCVHVYIIIIIFAYYIDILHTDTQILILILNTDTHSERNKVYMTAAHGKLAVVSACTNKLRTAGYAE